jgi:multicomponent Na+:H+ antiporter subunit D
MTTPGGLLLVLSVLGPFLGVLVGIALGARNARRVALVLLPLGLVIAIAISDAQIRSGDAVVYLLGGWAPPLGVALRADGLSAIMLPAVAVVICGIALYARFDFSGETRASLIFWTLLLGVWGSLNLIFVSSDLFTLYVALELLTFAAVPLVCLDGRSETLRSALRYLLFALLGSVFYLLGTVMLYSGHGTLDIALLAAQIHPEPAAWAAAALMTAGLLAKTALLPLHLWLPPAHAGAPAAASATLSALVIKGSWFVLVRLWFNVMPGVPGVAGAQLLAAFGAAAIVFGSVVALRQQRLKLLIAYSTVAQIGYLFLMFPLAIDPASGQFRISGALAGGMLQAISHATAKAAMFMSAGLIYAALGHDRITGLRGIAKCLPMSVLAFALGGIALVGVPPSGAYIAKELFLYRAAESEQWWWAFMIQTGGVLSSGYLLLVLVQMVLPADTPISIRVPIARSQEMAALALALASLLLGLVPWASLSVPPGILPIPLKLETFLTAFWPFFGGAVLAILLGHWGPPADLSLGKSLIAVDGPVRRVALAMVGPIEWVDRILQQWPTAGLALLTVTILLGTAMWAAW